MIGELLILITKDGQKECYVVDRSGFDNVRTSLLEENVQTSFSKWIEKLRSYCVLHGKSISYDEFNKTKKSFVGDIKISNTEYLEEYARGNAYG